MADRPAHHQVPHDQGLRHPGDDLPRVHRGLVRQGRRARRLADQSSAWASSPGSVAACPEFPGDRPAVERGPQARADQQVRCHLGRDAPDVSGPFLAMVRTGCFRAAGCRVAVRPERQEVRRWNRDGAEGRWSVARRSERPAQPVRELGARQDAELPLAGAPLVGAASAQPVASLGQMPLALWA